MPNAYVYCVSRELSRAAGGDYDACVEIDDIERFADALNAAFRNARGGSTVRLRCTLGPVEYRARTLGSEYYGLLSPSFVKEPRFRVEREVRLVWEGEDVGPEPYVRFEAPDIREYVRLVEIP